MSDQKRHLTIMTKTLIFPDLHSPQASVFAGIERTIDQENPDRVVFLGDYFDHWNDVADDAERTAQWLARSLEDERRIHLIGNHDASYFWPRREATYCPGWDPGKQAAVDRVLEEGSSNRFKFYVWIDGALLTHAGLATAWVPAELIDIPGWLDGEEAEARDAFSSGRTHWFAAVGSLRGGDHLSGGILWSDWRERRPPIRQIFGHTPALEVRRDLFSVCLDTNIGDGVRHYAVLSDRILTVRTLSGA
jgi:hypothetical protein